MAESTGDAIAEVVGALRGRVRGRVTGPADAGYDAARTVYYTGIDRRPLAVVEVADAVDVARVVMMAREADLPLAVRSGGHDIAGHGVVAGGIVADLTALRGQEIDVHGRAAWAGTGLTAGEYTAVTGEHGLTTGFGDTPSVGIGGITLGGGVGFLHRKLGLTIDSVLGAEVVTASGELIHVDAGTHPDLFWAIRGGGGNFGVVTRFRYRLHDVDEVVGGMLILPGTPEVITDLLGELTEASEALAGIVNVMVAPPAPFLPAEHHGRIVAMALLVHAGPIPEGERSAARLRSLASPIVDTLRPMQYVEMYEDVEPPKPARLAVRSFFVDEVDRAVAETVVDALERSNAPMPVAQFRVLGGAVARVPADATAFAHRHRRIMASVAAAYERPADASGNEAWVAEAAEALRQGAPGAYVGFMGEAEEARVREAYPGATWDRLAAVKARYDPSNLFRINQNVPPAEAGGA